MKFTKMQGLGNDYIYVNGETERIDNLSASAKVLSDRHYGIGADGLILIQKSEIADFKMEMYNSDGSRGEMCGNGIRCVGKYVYDKQLTDKTDLTIETLAGIRDLQLQVVDKKVISVKVDMGKPILAAREIPMLIPKTLCINEPIQILEKTYCLTGVSMGNPHVVLFVDCADSFPVEEIGRLLEHSYLFPNRVNVEFVEIMDRDTIKMRVWERGSGETLACGTGACAAVVASVLNHYTENQVTVKLLGGDLEIEWDREKDTVYMTGPAEMVFDGEIELY